MRSGRPVGSEARGHQPVSRAAGVSRGMIGHQPAGLVGALSKPQPHTSPHRALLEQRREHLVALAGW